MTDIIKLVLLTVIFILLFMMMKGFFSVMEAEKKGAKWISYPKHKPKKHGEEKSIRLLVSLENGNVLIDAYDFDEESFNVNCVDAYRYIPQSYKHQKKMMKSIFENIGGRK